MNIIKTPEREVKFRIPSVVMTWSGIKYWVLVLVVVGYIFHDKQVFTTTLETEPMVVSVSELTTEPIIVGEPNEDNYSLEAIEQIVENLSKVEIRERNLAEFKPLNKAPKLASPAVSGITAYQLFSWHLKAMESFVPHFYPDGQHDAIGFGFNLGNGMGIEFLKPHLADNKYTWEEGMADMKAWAEYNVMPGIKKLEDKRGKPFTEQQKAAIMCHAYNTGKVRTDVNGCCGFSKGCGSEKFFKTKRGKVWVRDLHNKRREEEVMLMQNRYPAARIEALRLQAIELENKWKNKPLPNCYKGKR